MADAPWEEPPERCTLPADEVHVWRAWLVLPPAALTHLEATLAPDEQERAHRFRPGAHRDRFITSRGIQRDILARYVGGPAAALQFEYGAHGKPELGGAFARSGLQFNVSNSGDVALCALAFQRDIGIDVEALRPISDPAAVAEHHFSPGERERLRKLLPLYGIVAFFECWTRKEAWIKAAGQGMSLPLDAFDVAFGPRKRPRLLRVRGRTCEARRWTMHALDAGDGYVAALCTTAGDYRLRCIQWIPHASLAEPASNRSESREASPHVD